jgi:hypothetical protein
VWYSAGDLHGDIKAARDALRIAGVLHPGRDEWIGGKTVIVQVLSKIGLACGSFAKNDT